MSNVRKIKPSHWNFLGNYLFSFLVFPLLIALWKRAGLTLHLHHNRIVIERGVLSKNKKEVHCEDIRTVEVSKSFTQRLFGIGDLSIATAGTGAFEGDIEGIPDPEEVKNAIRQRKEQKRS